MERVSVERLDPASATEAVLRAHHELLAALMAELEPEEPVVPFEHHVRELRSRVSFQDPQHLVARGRGGSAIGYARLDLEYADSNRHLAWFELGVLAAQRRRRTGAMLLHAVAELASADGRTMLGAEAVETPASDAFATMAGFERRATERKSRLRTARVDRRLMQRWVADAATGATGYEMLSYDGPTPAELVDAFVDLHAVTNTAPRDDLDMEDEVMTPDRLREEDARLAALGTQRWRVLARHAGSGELVGYTELLFPAHTRTWAEQWWTAVRPAHRGHGIGRWLKAVNVLRLLDERPEVEAVDTWNAFSNGPMLAINVAMGFELVRAYSAWQAPVDVVSERVKALLG